MSDNTTFGRRAPASQPLTPTRGGPPARGGPPPRQSQPQPFTFMPPPIDPAMKAEWAARSAARPAPVLTAAIIAMLAIVFAGEYGFSVGPVHGLAPGPNSLLALGALSRNLAIGAREPWRIVTAALLHANPAHIIGNCIVLFFAGAALERLVGRAWLAATFVIAGLAGSIASLCCNPPGVFGVGASGAIMGVLSATFVCSFHPHAAALRRTIRFSCARVAIPALIPFSSIEGGAHIDYNAHGGGFIAGVVIGLVMLKLWPETEVFPAHRRAAAGVGWTGLALAVAAFGMVALHYPAYARAGEPFASSLPVINATTMRDPTLGDQTAAAVRMYPHDPRTHLLRSVYLLNTHDLDQAETELRAGLAEREALTHAFPSVEPTLHLLLAGIYLEQNRRTDAETEAEPWCTQHYRDMGTEILRERLLTAGLCGGWTGNG